jgi:3-deoxy-D-manno-octulosonic-acid transferase
LKRLSGKKNIEIVLSTTTSTGYRVARDRYGDLALAVGPFPLDFLHFSSRTWNRIQPDLAILVDSELWPEHMYQARKRGVQVAIVNARMSGRSFARVSKAGSFRRLLVPPELHVMASAAQEAEKWRKVGIRSDRLSTTGNLKFDCQPEETLDAKAKNELLMEFGFLPEETASRPLVLFGVSTWPGEEEALIQFVAENANHDPPVRLVLTPRHAERGDEVAALLDKHRISWRRRSNETGAKGDGSLVYLADTTGELSRLVQVSDLVFVGKTLPPNEGGQNPVEAASFGIPLVFGPNTQNFSEMCRSLAETGAGIRVTDEEGLRKVLAGLLQDEGKRIAMGSAARRWKEELQGATDKTFGLLLDLLESRTNKVR